MIETTRQLTYDGFIKFVYSTYHILSSERYSQLNLAEKAREYLQTQGIGNVVGR